MQSDRKVTGFQNVVGLQGAAGMTLGVVFFEQPRGGFRDLGKRRVNFLVDPKSFRYIRRPDEILVRF